jgi:quercetin dioxygenase-like cupin family protein
MGFTVQTAKGLGKYSVDSGIDPQMLRMHITEIAPGTSAHAPHTHAGVEAFYVLEGHGTLNVDGEAPQLLGPNDVIILDPAKLHGLTNTGGTPMRYMVIIAKCSDGE